MRTTTRGIEKGTRIRFQARTGGRREPGVVTQVNDDGTVNVVLDQAGGYMAPVTAQARKRWERAVKKLCSTSVPKVTVDARAEAQRKNGRTR